MSTTTPPTSFAQVTGTHLAAGVLEQVNDTLFTVSNALLGASATVRLLPTRALVEFVPGSNIPGSAPSAPVLREQLRKYQHAFYASPDQLDEFLQEMA